MKHHQITPETSLKPPWNNEQVIDILKQFGYFFHNQDQSWHILDISLFTFHSWHVALGMSLLSCHSWHVTCEILLLSYHSILYTCNSLIQLFIYYSVHVTLDLLLSMSLLTCHSWLFTLDLSLLTVTLDLSLLTYHKTIQDNTGPM